MCQAKNADPFDMRNRGIFKGKHPTAALPFLDQLGQAFRKLPFRLFQLVDQKGYEGGATLRGVQNLATVSENTKRPLRAVMCMFVMLCCFFFFFFFKQKTAYEIGQ